MVITQTDVLKNHRQSKQDELKFVCSDKNSKNSDSGELDEPNISSMKEIDDCYDSNGCGFGLLVGDGRRDFRPRHVHGGGRYWRPCHRWQG